MHAQALSMESKERWTPPVARGESPIAAAAKAATADRSGPVSAGVVDPALSAPLAPALGFAVHPGDALAPVRTGEGLGPRATDLGERPAGDGDRAESFLSAEEEASSVAALEALRSGDPRDARFETAEDPRIPFDQMFFKIGEVARITGLKPYVLRYWEAEFPWIRPEKTRSRQRRYRRQDIALLLRIARLRYQERLTIENARQQIRDGRKQDGLGRRRRRSAKPDAVSRAGIQRALADMRRTVLELLEAVEE